MLSKLDIYFTSKDLKANFFCFYFLFVSCRFFLKNRSPRSASHLSSIDLLCFCSSQACIIFIVHPSIHPSTFPPLFTTQPLFYHWCMREEDRRKEELEEEEEEERKMDSFLLFCLSVCVTICFCSVMAL